MVSNGLLDAAFSIARLLSFKRRAFLFVGIVGNAGFSKGFLFPSSFECFPLSTEEEEEEETKAKEISFRETKV